MSSRTCTRTTRWCFPSTSLAGTLSRLGRFLLDPARWEKYERRSVPLSSATIVVTEEMKSRLASIGVDPEQITVVENLVDSERFLAYPLDGALQDDLRGRYVITYVGGFLSNRGLDTAIRSMAAVVRAIPEAILVLVGDGQVREQLETLTAELNLQDHVRFEGWVEFARVPSYLAASDVCIVPLDQKRAD